jgi:hypothetical protein
MVDTTSSWETKNENDILIQSCTRMNAHKGVMQFQILSPSHLVQFLNTPEDTCIASPLYLCKKLDHDQSTGSRVMGRQGIQMYLVYGTLYCEHKIRISVSSTAFVRKIFGSINIWWTTPELWVEKHAKWSVHYRCQPTWQMRKRGDPNTLNMTHGATWSPAPWYFRENSLRGLSFCRTAEASLTT